MEDEQIVTALNLWMDAYITDPEGFEQEYTAIKRHLAEKDDALIPSYGQISLAYMKRLLAETEP